LVRLDGLASRDPEGQTLAFAWAVTGGDPITLTEAYGATPHFQVPDASGAGGQGYTDLQLTVTDGTSSATDTVRVWFEPPEATGPPRADRAAGDRPSGFAAAGPAAAVPSPLLPLLILLVAAALAGLACAVVLRRRQAQQ
jgi:hypothetical protein